MEVRGAAGCVVGRAGSSFGGEGGRGRASGAATPESCKEEEEKNQAADERGDRRCN